MDMVAEVAVEELERIFPGFKFNKALLKFSTHGGKSKNLVSITKEAEYKRLTPHKKAKVREYVNFIISVSKADKLKHSRSKSFEISYLGKTCPI